MSAEHVSIYTILYTSALTRNTANMGLSSLQRRHLPQYLDAHRKELQKAAAGPNPNFIGVKLPDHERDHKLLRFAQVKFIRTP